MWTAVTNWLSNLNQTESALMKLAVPAFLGFLGFLVSPVFLQSKADRKKERQEREKAFREQAKEERDAKQHQHNLERDRLKDEESSASSKKIEADKIKEVMDDASRSLKCAELEDRLVAIEKLKRVIEADADAYGPTVLRSLCAFLKKPRSEECLAVERHNCCLSEDVKKAMEIIREQTYKHGGAFGEALDLERAQLRDAKWTHVKLPGATLFGANMEYSELFEADFTNANLRRANLAGATFKRANFSGACLTDACLKNIRSSKDADFSCADLVRAELHGADLANVKNLTSDQIRRAYGDQCTRLPVDVTPPESWFKERREQNAGTRDPRQSGSSAS